MDVEILIHGVPDGQDYFGIKSEQTNMELFYDSSIESVKFVVETKKQENQAYAYYSYLRYKNMIGAGGRPGSYFGLTLRLDMYYQDVMLIYDLLEIVFKKHIVGTLLTPTTDGYKYIVPSIRQKKTEIENLQNTLLQLLQTSCVVSKFLPLDKSFLNPISTTAICNIHDITESLMLATIKKYSKAALSPDYPLNAIKEYEKKLKEADSKGGNIIAEKDKKIAEKDSTIDSLTKEVSTQQNKIAILEQENKRKDTEIQQLRQKGDLTQQVAKIKEPIVAIAEYFRIKDPSPKEPDYGHKSYKLGIINGILTCIVSVVIVVLFFIFRPDSVDPTKSKEYKELKTQYEDLLKTYNGLLIQIKKQDSDSQAAVNKAEERREAELKAAETRKAEAKKKAEEEKKAAEAKKKAEAEKKAAEDKKKAEEASKAAAKNFSIVIEPKVVEVEIGKEYSFSISGYEGNGTWGVDGFSAPGDKSASAIKVTAIDKGNQKATISYTPEGGQKKTISFNYKQNE